MKVLELFLLWTYALYVGFFMYGSAIQAWNRLKIAFKILIAPVVIIFGIMDVGFNVVFGSIMFLEPPFIHGITFSQRCCHWYILSGWRSSLAGAWSVPLNEIVPNHIK